MTETNFITIAPAHFESELVIKKSRFITQLDRVDNEEQAQTLIGDIRKTHHKANHNVYAYVLGDQNQLQRMSDDGEPTGTAGSPMLDAIQKRALRNVLVVVTRYFGGIKLGAGGLIRAYSNATTTAFDQVPLVEKIERQIVHATVDYPQADRLTNWLNQADETFTSEYQSRVKFSIAIETTRVDQVTADITNYLNSQVEFTLGDLQYVEVPFQAQA